MSRPTTRRGVVSYVLAFGVIMPDPSPVVCDFCLNLSVPLYQGGIDLLVHICSDCATQAVAQPTPQPAPESAPDSVPLTNEERLAFVPSPKTPVAHPDQRRRKKDTQSNVDAPDTCDKSRAENPAFLSEISWHLSTVRVRVSLPIVEGATLCGIWKIHARQSCSTASSLSSRRWLTASYSEGGSTSFAAPS